MQFPITPTLKDKIVSFIRLVGPSLPIRIAKEIKTSTLFTSAYLSELTSDKVLKASYLRVGNSPLYYLPSQENLLERFSNHLKSKEKEAFELLKNKRLLKDEEQEPAIRLALKSIKDFAIPFYKEGKLYWRYFLEKEESQIEKKEEIVITPLIKEVKKQIEKQEVDKENERKIIQKDITSEPTIIKNEKIKKKIQKKKKVKKRDENLFNKVKDFLGKRDIEILDIQDFNRDHLILKINENNKEKILIVYNKKKISEEDIINANKKISDYKMNYSILSFGEPSKKLDKLITAIKNLDSIEKLE